jgi:hypothetical protein
MMIGYAGALFLLLATICLIAAHMLGVRQLTARQRMYVAITIGFLAWMLPLMVSLRSR